MLGISFASVAVNVVASIWGIVKSRGSRWGVGKDLHAELGS